MACTLVSNRYCHIEPKNIKTEKRITTHDGTRDNIVPGVLTQKNRSVSHEVIDVAKILALFPTLIGHTSINYGVRHLRPLTVSFFTLAEPIIASITAALILSEVPPFREFPSYALFLGATVLYLVKSRET